MSYDGARALDFEISLCISFYGFFLHTHSLPLSLSNTLGVPKKPKRRRKGRDEQNQHQEPQMPTLFYHSTLLYTLSSLLYPVPATPLTRRKPLKVLCLGLPRTGTESLQHALLELGYDGVSHGFEWWIHVPGYSKIYYELALLRAQNRLPAPDVLRTQYFDRVLGEYEATTDVPGAWFAEELLRAYPEAKVIVNHRQNARVWKESFRGSVLPTMQSWETWWTSWFQAECFWTWGLTYWLHGERLFGGNFERNAEGAYERHYEGVEAVLRETGREYLDWRAEDGWDPLCEFLGKEVPDTPFPKGNLAVEFGPKIAGVGAARARQAIRNAVLVLLITGGAAAMAWRWFVSR